MKWFENLWKYLGWRFLYRIASFKQIIVWISKTKLTDLLEPESCFMRTSSLTTRALNLSYDWLSKSLSLWPNFELFQKAKDFINTTKVVIDAAERKVKLHTDYLAILTDNSEESARILRAVEKSQRCYLDFCKIKLQK